MLYKFSKLQSIQTNTYLRRQESAAIFLTRVRVSMCLCVTCSALKHGHFSEQTACSRAVLCAAEERPIQLEEGCSIWQVVCEHVCMWPLVLLVSMSTPTRQIPTPTRQIPCNL